MAGNIIDGILDAPRFSGDSRADFRTLERFLAELCGQLRFVLSNLSGDNFNDTEFIRYANEMLRTDSLVTDSLYADFGMIAGLTVSRLRTDYMRAARYRAKNKSALRYLDIRDDKIVFYTADYAGGETVLCGEGGARLYYTDGDRKKMTTVETPYPVTVYTYTETPLFTITIGENGTEMNIRYRDDGSIRFSENGVSISAGETTLSVTKDGIVGLNGSGVPLYVDGGDGTAEAAEIGAVIIKKKEDGNGTAQNALSG